MDSLPDSIHQNKFQNNRRVKCNDPEDVREKVFLIPHKLASFVNQEQSMH